MNVAENKSPKQCVLRFDSIHVTPNDRSVAMRFAYWHPTYYDLRVTDNHLGGFVG